MCVIATYIAVSALTGQMLVAARTGDWGRLGVLECECARHVKSLQAEELGAKLSPPQHQHKLALIEKILADDRDIRTFTEPWMERVSALLGSRRTEHELSKTYGAPPPV